MNFPIIHDGDKLTYGRCGDMVLISYKTPHMTRAKPLFAAYAGSGLALGQNLVRIFETFQKVLEDQAKEAK